jgi:enoyl-CoA hydratase/carnithine racemase
MELRSIGVLARTEDAREAIAAFAAKRAPVFTGH